MEQFSPGSELGRFRIERFVSIGAWSSIYEAEDAGSKVALSIADLVDVDRARALLDHAPSVLNVPAARAGGGVVLRPDAFDAAHLAKPAKK